MVIEYQGTEFGKATKFTLRIIGNNLSKRSSNYQIELLEGDKQLPIKITDIHQSLYSCLKELYLYSKYNGIVLDPASEVVGPKLVPYDLVLYNSQKHELFRA